MSVGYNLEGIKQPPMQQFIDNMMDASDHPKFAQYRDTLNKLLQDDAFLARHGLQEKRESLQALPARIPTSICLLYTSTLSRGETIFCDGTFTGKAGRGRFLRRKPFVPPVL